MINKFLFVCLMIFSFSCSQKNNSIEFNNKKMVDKTFYFIDYNYNKKCGFEIYINDILVKRYLKPVNIDNSITPINPYIINSGNQEVKVVLYPFDGNNITSDADFSLKIFRIDNYNNEILTSASQGKVIFELPKLILDKNNSNIWNYTGKFEIYNLPYSVEGWGESKDLTKINDIDRKVREKFSLIWNSLNTKNSDLFINMLSKSMEESKKFYYLTNEQEKNSIKGVEELISAPNIQCVSIDNTVLKFYAHGRLVTLETLDGKPAIRIIESQDGYNSEDSFPILLHMPQNSSELEIIR